jgi:hypothetical protein
MSTKIYDAYLYTGTIEQLMEDLHNFKVLWKDNRVKAFKFFKEAIFDNAAEYEFKRWKGYKKHKKITPDKIYFTHLYDYFRSEKNNIIRSDIVNVNASVVVYFFEGKIYTQFYINDNVFMKSLSHNKRFKDFHYQDQTDRPKGISDKMWKERERIWDGIFKQTFLAPVDVGLIYEIGTDTVLYDIARELT